VGIDRAGDHRAARPVDAAGAGGARIGGDLAGIADADDRAVDREDRGSAARAYTTLAWLRCVPGSGA
jgi:hypothetical protein